MDGSAEVRQLDIPLEINSEYNPSFRIPDFVGECNNLAFLYNICILYKRMMDSIKQLFGAGKGRRSRKRTGGNPLDNLKPIQGGEKKETYGGGDGFDKTIGAVGGFPREVSGGTHGTHRRTHRRTHGGKRKSKRGGRKSRRSRRGGSSRK